MTCTVSKKGDNKWVFNQKNKKAGGPDVTITWVFTDTGIEMEYKSGGTVSKQFFARQ